MSDLRNVEGLPEPQTSTPIAKKKGFSPLGAAKSFIMTIGLITAADKGMDIRRNPEVVPEGAARIVRNAGAIGGDGLKNFASIVNANDQKIPAKGTTLEQSLGVQIESKDTVDHAIDLFYPGISGKDRKDLSDQILITKAYMSSILTDESFKNLDEHQELFDNAEKFSGVPGIIIKSVACAESRGGLDMVSGSGAVGPVGVSEDFGRDKKFRVTGDENDQRLVWKDSINLAAEETAASAIYFSGQDNPHPNWGLAVWRWHLGRDGVKQQIENFSANNALSFTDIPTFVRDNHITVFKILGVKNIREELEKPGYDRTPVYVLRVAACASLLGDKGQEK